MEICIRSLKREYIRSMKGQYGSNCIASWSEFARNIEKIQQQTIGHFNKSWPNFSRRKYGSTSIVLDSRFSKDAWKRYKARAFDGNLERILERTIWVRLYLSFENSWKFFERTTWIESYCLFCFLSRIPVLENWVNNEI